MSNHVVIDHIRSDVYERVLWRWDADLATTKPDLPFRVCKLDRTFVTEMAPVGSPVSVHWESAKGEKFLSQFGGNKPLRVRRGAQAIQY
jgi:hypothetical protein